MLKLGPDGFTDEQREALKMLDNIAKKFESDTKEYPNEKRCETCRKRRTDECPVVSTPIPGYEDVEDQERAAWDITELVGCTIHEDE